MSTDKNKQTKTVTKPNPKKPLKNKKRNEFCTFLSG